MGTLLISGLNNGLNFMDHSYQGSPYTNKHWLDSRVSILTYDVRTVKYMVSYKPPSYFCFLGYWIQYKSCNGLLNTKITVSLKKIT